MSMVVSLYQKTSDWQEVIEAHVLKNIIQVSDAGLPDLPTTLLYVCGHQLTLLTCCLENDQLHAYVLCN